MKILKKLSVFLFFSVIGTVTTLSQILLPPASLPVSSRSSISVFLLRISFIPQLLQNFILPLKSE
ncbi:MAG: hypothetical protein FJ216_09625 [Ignavibacteria bacterium]|nr:hypothetical protein [Ignavibacteria bacterium]